MITLIHGNDTAASRKYFLDQKQNYQNSISINGKTVTITDLVQAFEGGELFTESKSFFIEDIIDKKKKSKDLTQTINYLNKNSDANDIFVWEANELTKPTINAFDKPIIKVFKLPQSLFMFLDSIRPGNGKSLINLFHETIQSLDVEMVYFMMVRQVRILLGLLERSGNNIDEVQRLAPWQKGKLQKQADYFDAEQLKNFYKHLFEIEKGMKTGTLSAPLVSAIDFLLLSI